LALIRINYSLKGLSVGTFCGASILKTIIRTPPFLLGLSNKKFEGDDELEDDRTREDRATDQEEISFSARIRVR
jgi:hypothetical protein